MLVELLPKQYEFKFGEGVIALRFTLGALLKLEQAGLSYMDILAEKVSGKVILEFFRAGLVTPVDEKKLPAVAEALGYEKLLAYLIEAVLMTLPKREENVIYPPPKPDDPEFSFLRLRALICDVMGKSEEYFWGSTLAELLERWTEYAQAMGYAEEPEKILEFDNEGM